MKSNYSTEQQDHLVDRLLYNMGNRRKITLSEVQEICQENPLEILTPIACQLPFGFMQIDQGGLSYLEYIGIGDNDTPLYRDRKNKEEFAFLDLMLQENQLPLYDEDTHEAIVREIEAREVEVKEQQFKQRTAFEPKMADSVRSEIKATQVKEPNYTFEKDKFCVFVDSSNVAFFPKGTVIPTSLIDGAALCDTREEVNWFLVSREEAAESFIADLIRGL